MHKNNRKSCIKSFPNTIYRLGEIHQAVSHILTASCSPLACSPHNADPETEFYDRKKNDIRYTHSTQPNPNQTFKSSRRTRRRKLRQNLIKNDSPQPQPQPGRRRRLQQQPEHAFRSDSVMFWRRATCISGRHRAPASPICSCIPACIAFCIPSRRSSILCI